MFTQKKVIIGVFSSLAILVFSYCLIAGNKETPSGEQQHNDKNEDASLSYNENDIMGFELGRANKTTAQERKISPLNVDKAVICLEVRDRMPVQETFRIPSNRDKIFCWALFLNGEGKKIRYIWQIGETVTTSQWLTITSNKYRAWCPKKIDRKTRGHCRVDVVDEQGRILKSLDFEIIPPTPSKLEMKYS
ncbi:MAG: DUF2914 domain-containing protein [Planctomycetota bacterium]|nr:DUF2914 domain-containing protein [Planctomycetota bacterium]MDI6786844.1 DUF2914 domain-containing protein [Planctomycetota bacterium]